jgi:predicted DCC family thiol-disulfide oxidoreductase YuxK
MGAEPARALVVYDDGCSLCRGVVSWVRARDVHGSLTFLPCASPELGRLAPGVTREQCERAMVVSLPDGSTRSGAAAVPEILARLPRWRMVAPVLRWAPLRPLARALYRWIAAHRPRQRPGSSRTP